MDKVEKEAFQSLKEKLMSGLVLILLSLLKWNGMLVQIALEQFCMRATFGKVKGSCDSIDFTEFTSKSTTL